MFISTGALAGVEGRPTVYDQEGTEVKPVPTRAWLESGVAAIDPVLTFYYEWGHTLPQITVRRSIIDHLEEQGLINRSPKIKRLWASLQITQLMTITYFNFHQKMEASSNVASKQPFLWDTVLLRILSVVLNATLGTRVGAIVELKDIRASKLSSGRILRCFLTPSSHGV
jgi:hypothetical protein